MKRNAIRDMAAVWAKRLSEYNWWELTIFAVGLVSFATIIVVLFLPFGDGPADFTATAAIPAVSEPKFLDLFAGSFTLPVLPGEPVKILHTGDEFLASFLSDIDAAQSSINIMIYIWDKGKMSDEIFSHIDAKLKEGVEVRIMVDDYGALRAKYRQEFQDFEKLGGKVEIYHPLTVVPWNLAHNHKRNHRRAITIDGKIAYTGGMAVGDEWLEQGGEHGRYRDLMFRVTGEMARSVQGAFAELWASDTGELLTGEKFFPTAKAENSNIKYIPLPSTPNDSLIIQNFFLLSAMAAKDKIYITNPYFIPDNEFQDTLISKAKEGLDVRVLLPNEQNDSTGVRYASEWYYSELLKSGVKIYEYQPELIHTKAMVVDGEWSVIGSANLDRRSRRLNEENILGVLDPGLGKELEGVFFEDIGNSKEIMLSEWEKRSVWRRLREIFALKFVQQY